MTQDDNQTPVDRALVDQTTNEMSSTKLDFNPGADPELRRKQEEARDRIRQYLRADGGSERVKASPTGLVVGHALLGACGTCPMSTMTLRAGIEQALKRSVPQISRVEAVNAPSAY